MFVMIIFNSAIDGVDYIGGKFTVTFTSGLAATGNNLQCFNLTLLNDESLENNETLLMTLSSSQQDAGFVRISSTRKELFLTIIERPGSDS